MYPLEVQSLNVPSLTEVKEVLSRSLPAFFEEVEVEVTPCPDLRESPYLSSFQGLSSPGDGNVILDVGGVDNLLPRPNKKKLYDLSDLVRQAVEKLGLTSHPTCLVGAGAGPCHVYGMNSELICNTCITGSSTSKVALMIPQEETGKEKHEVKDDVSNKSSVLLNVMLTEGKPGEVLRIRLRGRAGKDERGKDVPQCIADCLKAHYGESRPVSLGGLLVLKKGRARLHCMPDFSKEPIRTPEGVDEWLRWMEGEAPMRFMFVATSADPGMDLRLVHTHGWGEAGGRRYGGHYHNDTTPEAVEYEMVCMTAGAIARLDRVTQTPNWKRDASFL
uniref:DUF1907 domain-containing protein n=1 Tax=Chromera velia CCMP2878 TaxID=1169474 RepID=A0A0G4FHT6_9ALVE|eukprot:Cvel_17070.t1-p1 / transcript=Cvel_17070.t1 / gene=Cvel_17070 / organism=Chromera_velia_CCMP2878 / gene_product=Ester hydrolase C11orf54 homolog, putative / transcript_product=Ester hydrolase C11orf54 homolog, putative / location=Cvel_scaffold1345:41831-42823(-) / protein_length=331 / sequence_SO=supercontig / SO=protein_coding / is_pseudo=false